MLLSSTRTRQVVFTIVVVFVAGALIWVAAERSDSDDLRGDSDAVGQPDDVPNQKHGDSPRWTASIEGFVDGMSKRPGEDEVVHIELAYDDEPEFDDESVDLPSPISVVASRDVFEEQLGGIPELDQRLLVEIEGTHEEAIVFPVQHVEPVDESDGD